MYVKWPARADGRSGDRCQPFAYALGGTMRMIAHTDHSIGRRTFGFPDRGIARWDVFRVGARTRANDLSSARGRTGRDASAILGLPGLLPSRT